MIFQALISLYDRLENVGKVPEFGFSIEEIGFCITLDEDGNMVGEPEDLRTERKANEFDYRLSEVPYSNEVNVRSSNAATTPNFLVDKAAYIFGMSGTSMKKDYIESFLKHIDKVVGNSTDKGILAVKRFLHKWKPEESVKLPLWNKISGEKGKWIAFRLEGDDKFVHERPEAKRLWRRYLEKKQYPKGISFVDGKEHNIQKQFAQFKFAEARQGASLVSFNEKAYESYCKKRGENALIGVLEEFKASTALKYLLRSRQRIRIGDAETLYWAERETPLEGVFGVALDPSIEMENASLPVRKFLDSLRSGRLDPEFLEDRSISFYILGLSLNKTRLAVRFWFVNSVEELVSRLHAHFKCLEMEKDLMQEGSEFPGLWHLLRETARESKDKTKNKSEHKSQNISPLLAGALLRSIITGCNYPLQLFYGVLNRIKADQSKKNEKGRSIPNVNYMRAAILKAVLIKNFNKEVTMSLDTSRREPAYLLGRLFAILERTQTDALGPINTTIKDRYYSSASTTPASIFPTLLRLAQHHIEKSDYGYLAERRIASVMDHIDAFPTNLDLQEQGLFAIGYYHQKNAIDREIKEAAAQKQAA